MLASERIPVATAFFDPSAERAQQLDQRMRRRLAESVRYIAAEGAALALIESAALAGARAYMERAAR